MKNFELEIVNIGPIKQVNITLNKVNIFMGAQSREKVQLQK